MANIIDLVLTTLLFSAVLSADDRLKYKSISEFLLLHHPKYIKFDKTHEAVNTDEIGQLITGLFGLPTTQHLRWKGVRFGSIFHRPKANVAVVIPGCRENLLETSPDVSARYPLNIDVPYINFGSISDVVASNFITSEPLSVDVSVDNFIFSIRSSFDDMFSHIPVTFSKVLNRLARPDSITYRYSFGNLNVSHTSDALLMAELQTIMDVIETIKKNPRSTKQKAPDTFSFALSGLEGICKEDSSRCKDARDSLSKFVVKMKEEFKAIYNDNFVMEVITLPVITDGDRARISRSLKMKEEGASSLNINLSPDYSNNYPVIFNIVLWLMIALVLAMFAIAHSIWYLDPGRDSIIYRMTSQRMKKDN